MSESAADLFDAAPEPPPAPASNEAASLFDAAPDSHGDNLGVQPLGPAPEMPQTDPEIVDELHQRAAAQAAGERPGQRSAALAAFRAANAGLTPEQGAQALVHADKTGLSPTFTATALPEVQDAAKEQDLRDAFEKAPVTADYAAQGPAQAAAVAGSIGPLGTIERLLKRGKNWLWSGSVVDALGRGLEDIGYNEVATIDTSNPGFLRGGAEEGLQEHEAVRAWEAEHAKQGLVQKVAEAVPGIALYSAAETAGGPLGMFLMLHFQNAGALERQIAKANSAAFSQALDAEEGRLTRQARGEEVGAPADLPEPALTPDEVHQLALRGSAAGAAIGTALGLPFIRALPGAAQTLDGAGLAVVSKLASTPGGRAAVRSLLAYGGHTLSGALMMTAQATVNDATVQEAVTGKVDAGRTVRTAAQTFLDVLPVAAALSGIPLVRQVLTDRGRIAQSVVDAGELDALGGLGKRAPMIAQAPDHAEQLIGQQAAQSDTPAVYIDAAALREPGVAAKVTDALGDNGRAVAEAQATGNAVRVPVESYIVAGLHDQVRDFARLSPDGASMTEAARLQKAFGNLTDATPTRFAEHFGGTIDEWSQALNTELPDGSTVREALKKMLQAPREPTAGDLKARALADFAKQVVEGSTPIGEFDPARYERAAEAAAARAQESAKAAAEANTKSAGDLVPTSPMVAEKQGVTDEQRANAINAAVDTNARVGRADEVARHEGVRDINRALAQAHSDAQDRAETLSARVTKLASDSSRARFSRAGQEFLDAFDAITEAVGARARSRSDASIEPALQRLTDADAVLVFDDVAIRDLVKSPKEWNSLKLDEAQNVHDALKNLSKAVSDTLEVEANGRKQALREAVTGVREHLSRLPDLPKPAAGNAEPGALEEVGSKLKALRVENTKPELLLEKALGQLGKDVFQDYIRARGHLDELRVEIAGRFKALLDTMPKAMKARAGDAVEGPATSRLDSGKWVRADLWRLLGWMGSKSGIERATNGLNVSETEIRRVLEQLTPEEVKFVQGVWDLHDEHVWPLIAAHAKERSGIEPSKVEAQPGMVAGVETRGGYEHAVYNREATARAVAEAYASGNKDAIAQARGMTPKAGSDAPQSIADYWGDLKRGVASVAKGFTKGRAQRFFAVPDLRWDAQASNLQAQLHYLAFDNYVQNLGRVLRDPELRGLVQDKWGKDFLGQLDEHLMTVARGGAEAPVSGAAKWASVIGGGFLRRTATAAFALNFPVVAGQISHLPGGMLALRVHPKYMLEGVARALLPNRWGDAHAETAQHDPGGDVAYRWNDYTGKMRETLEGASAREASPLKRKLDAMSWSLYHTMDGFLSQAFYHAGKARALDQGAVLEDAVKAGNQLVRDAMPPLNMAERGSLARDRGVLGSLLLVRNFPATLANWYEWNAWRAQTQVWEMPEGQRSAIRIAGTQAVAAGAALGGVLAVSVLGKYLMGHGKRDDETQGQWIERHALAAPFEPFPLVNEAASKLADAAVSRKPFAEVLKREADFRQAPAIAMVQDTIRDLGETQDRHLPIEDRLFKASEVLMRLKGIPVAPMKQGKFVYDTATGRLRPRGPVDLAAGLTYGKRKKQPANPLTDLSKALRE